MKLDEEYQVLKLNQQPLFIAMIIATQQVGFAGYHSKGSLLPACKCPREGA